MNLYNEEGVKLANNDDHEAALNNYTRAIKDSAEDSVLMPIFLSNRAHSLISLDKLDEAIADCTRAAKCDPKCVMAYVAHSKVYAYKGKLGQALDLLRQALSKDKENKGVQAKI
jgi:tetratricopeptide (TPR) repeat protein|tara:strand:+ start:13 stop:354 length:342 start_codon:yes stop_codon:yes gene_type:complete